METVSITYVLGLLGLVSLVILGFLFVVYCHETGLKLTPKLSWVRVALNFLSSFWKNEKELRTLRKEIEKLLMVFKAIPDKEGLCWRSYSNDCNLIRYYVRKVYLSGTFWWPCYSTISKEEAARPRILYLEFMLKNVHLVHEFIKISKKLENEKELSVSELEGLKQRHTFLKSFLSPTQIK